MVNDSDRGRLESLAKRIDQAQKVANPMQSGRVSEGAKAHTQAAQMIRVGSDFVAGIVLSGALGWYLDRRLDTAPWLMLALLVVGFVFGFWTILRFLSKKTDDDEGRKE
ncbi:MAG: AtpZ/AtpI family protein [Bdellovibrionales bacterium]|jgi:ATP synthase protein I